jgi:tetratricopeptide (TPR) repeat protein
MLINACAALPIARAPSFPDRLPPVEEPLDAGAPVEDRAVPPASGSDLASPQASGSAVVALLDTAAIKEQQGDYDTSLAVLERAVRIEPRNPQVWHRLARVNLRHGDAGQAEMMARKSIQFAGNDRQLQAANWRLIAAARRQLGDLKGADAAEAQAVIVESPRR